jgi:hypothetical protein
MLHDQQPGAAPREPGTVSRRRLIFTGASLAAAGVAVGAAASIPFSAGESSSDGAGADPEVPVMVHLRSATDGTFDVFFGSKRVQVTDRAFAARLTNTVTAG